MGYGLHLHYTAPASHGTLIMLRYLACHQKVPMSSLQTWLNHLCVPLWPHMLSQIPAMLATAHSRYQGWGLRGSVPALHCLPPFLCGSCMCFYHCANKDSIPLLLTICCCGWVTLQASRTGTRECEWSPFAPLPPTCSASDSLTQPAFSPHIIESPQQAPRCVATFCTVR